MHERNDVYESLVLGSLAAGLYVQGTTFDEEGGSGPPLLMAPDDAKLQQIAGAVDAMKLVYSHSGD